jgi:hypothetical protein
LRPISLFPTTVKLLEKFIQKVVQKQLYTSNLLNASQFVFRVRHITTHQCMILTDHITMNFKSSMSAAAVILDIEKASDNKWHPSLLYKISKLQFSAKLTILIKSYFFYFFLNCPLLPYGVEGFLPVNLIRLLVGLLGRVIGLTQGLYLHTGQHNTEKCRNTSMLRAGFGPAISTFVRLRTVPASDRSATETG